MMIVGYFANSLKYYQAVSIILNIFGTAPDLLSAPLTTDLFYVHQRGKVMAWASVVAIIGIDVSSIISGNIIAKLGVKYLYIISFCVMFVLFALNYLFVWETNYTRPSSMFSTAGEKPGRASKDMPGETLMTPTGEARDSTELSPTPTQRDLSPAS